MALMNCLIAFRGGVGKSCLGWTIPAQLAAIEAAIDDILPSALLPSDLQALALARTHAEPKTQPGLKWRSSSIASGPVARISAARPRLLTDTHVTIKPRFFVALLALALAGAPAGTALAQSMA